MKVKREKSKEKKKKWTFNSLRTSGAVFPPDQTSDDEGVPAPNPSHNTTLTPNSSTDSIRKTKKSSPKSSARNSISLNDGSSQLEDSQSQLSSSVSDRSITPPPEHHAQQQQQQQQQQQTNPLSKSTAHLAITNTANNPVNNSEAENGRPNHTKRLFKAPSFTNLFRRKKIERTNSRPSLLPDIVNSISVDEEEEELASQVEVKPVVLERKESFRHSIPHVALPSPRVLSGSFDSTTTLTSFLESENSTAPAPSLLTNSNSPRLTDEQQQQPLSSPNTTKVTTNVVEECSNSIETPSPPRSPLGYSSEISPPPSPPPVQKEGETKAPESHLPPQHHSQPSADPHPHSRKPSPRVTKLDICKIMRKSRSFSDSFDSLPPKPAAAPVDIFPLSTPSSPARCPSTPTTSYPLHASFITNLTAQLSKSASSPIQPPQLSDDHCNTDDEHFIIPPHLTSFLYKSPSSPIPSPNKSEDHSTRSSLNSIPFIYLSETDLNNYNPSISSQTGHQSRSFLIPKPLMDDSPRSSDVKDRKTASVDILSLSPFASADSPTVTPRRQHILSNINNQTYPTNNISPSPPISPRVLNPFLVSSSPHVSSTSDFVNLTDLVESNFLNDSSVDETQSTTSVDPQSTLEHSSGTLNATLSSITTNTDSIESNSSEDTQSDDENSGVSIIHNPSQDIPRVAVTESESKSKSNPLSASGQWKAKNNNNNNNNNKSNSNSNNNNNNNSNSSKATVQTKINIPTQPKKLESRLIIPPLSSSGASGLKNSVSSLTYSNCSDEPTLRDSAAINTPSTLPNTITNQPKPTHTQQPPVNPPPANVNSNNQTINLQSPPTVHQTVININLPSSQQSTHSYSGPYNIVININPSTTFPTTQQNYTTTTTSTTSSTTTSQIVINISTPNPQVNM